MRGSHSNVRQETATAARPGRLRDGGHAVYVACSTLCFSRLPLDEALRTIREFRFTKADLAVGPAGAQLTPAEISADMVRVAQRLKAGNLPLAAIRFDCNAAVEPRRTRSSQPTIIHPDCRARFREAGKLPQIPIRALSRDIPAPRACKSSGCEAELPPQPLPK